MTTGGGETGKRAWKTAETKDFRDTGVPPAQMGDPPDEMGEPPGKMGAPLGEMGVPPDKTPAPPGGMGEPPSRVGVPPDGRARPPSEMGEPPERTGAVKIRREDCWTGSTVTFSGGGKVAADREKVRFKSMPPLKPRGPGCGWLTSMRVR